MAAFALPRVEPNIYFIATPYLPYAAYELGTCHDLFLSESGSE